MRLLLLDPLAEAAAGVDPELLCDYAVPGPLAAAAAAAAAAVDPEPCCEVVFLDPLAAAIPDPVAAIVPDPLNCCNCSGSTCGGCCS